MGKTQCPCCFCRNVCTGVPNSIGTINFAVGGLHAQYVSKPLRNLRDSYLFDYQCLKVSCASPDTAIGVAGPVAITSTAAFKRTTCCASVGFVVPAGQGASTPVYNSRDYSFTVSKHLSGTNADPCPPFTPLPWQLDSELLFKRYATLIAKRIIDSVHLRICPTVGPYGVLQWTITADVCWRVVYRLRESVSLDLDYDHWQHKRFYTYENPGDWCVGSSIKKHCGNACSVGTVFVSGSSDFGISCAVTGAPPSTSGYDPTPITTIGEPCTGSAASGPGAVTDTTTVFQAKQKRVITIDRDCELPSTLTFPYSALSGLNGDIDVGWVDPGYLQACVWADPLARVYSGDRTSFNVYQAMTESWTISLS